MTNQRRLLVVGAGPIGLEAALGAIERGFDVTVLEQGRIGEALRRWGSTRFFSPFEMNLSPRAKTVLGSDLPAPSALLTGAEMVSRVLEPLAARAPLAGRIHTGHRVVAIGRARMSRRDMPGHPVRAERPFRVLVEGPSGEEALEAEVVLDASGVTGQPTALGAGGIPVPGERAIASRIIRHLGDLQQQLPGLEGKRVLLVGHGHSAANAIVLLERMACEAPGTQITWAVHSIKRRPCLEVARDPLGERERVVALANAFAEEPRPRMRVERRAIVESIAEAAPGQFQVRFTGDRLGTFDAIAAFTGYRPDLSIVSELQLEISPSTEGVARLDRALSCVTDCLSVPKLRPEDLGSGEPGFHLIGAKSYGRASSFLLQNGVAQLESILGALTR